MNELDWTRGGGDVAVNAAIVYQQCGACHQRWYFQRDFCPACGDRTPATLASSGLGTVYASTVAHRAPSDAFRAITPYALVLVDLDEGVRVMGQADPSAAASAIGARVVATVRTIAGRAMPYFEPEDSE